MTTESVLPLALTHPHGVPAAMPLSNGRLTTLLSAAGGGGTTFGDLAVTRWTPDRTRDADASVLYVRDLDDGAFWSAGANPVARRPDRYAARFGPGCVTLEREDAGIVTRLEVCVPPDADVELRRVTLRNLGDRPRRLDVTSYAEIVLNSAAGDAGHPAFSKLFVQTELDAARGVLLAKRRLRSPDDTPLWAAHALYHVGTPARDALELETDRARFLGRGRTTASPEALTAGTGLGGSIGNVLDPVFALRRGVELAAGASVTLVALLAAGASRQAVVALMDRFTGTGAAREIEEAFHGAARRAHAVIGALGIIEARLDASDASAIPHAIGAIAYRHPAGVDAMPDPVPDDADAHQAPPLADDRALFAAARHVALGAPSPSPARAAASLASSPAARRVATAVAGKRMTSGDAGDGDAEPLQLFNGIGGFSAGGDEYVIRVPHADARPPLPWSNVIANERIGFITSESGASSTWSANSRENRLTPWTNDPVSDPHGEALWLRDEDAHTYWSPTGGPTPPPGPVETRHGFGCTRWRHEHDGLAQDVVAFVPRHDPVKIVRVRVTNTGTRARRLTAFSYAQLVLGVHPWESGAHVVTALDGAVIRATNAEANEFASLVAFAAAVPLAHASGARATADRAAFLGVRGQVEAPAALRGDAPLDGRGGDRLDPCAAFSMELAIGPGETADCMFLLGQGVDTAEVDELLGRYASAAAVDEALEGVRGFWRDLLGAVRIATPSPALDLMVNGWLGYQNLACRIWGRSAYYQSGGAFGFRDQLQDAAAMLYHDAAIARRQIVLHAAHQFVEGDVMHWWHPPLSKGIRTRFADDLLWLPYVTAGYVATTGDHSVLDERARFVTARLLEDGEDEAFLVPDDAGRDADVYEHCCMTIDRSLPTGTHGLPLMGTGDWNDGMNRVGREGRGESVWLGFFLAHVLDRFIPLCEHRGDGTRAARYREHLASLSASLNDGGWDGGWYRRAYYDDGTPLGSASSDECRIDAIAQAWSVLSGVAPRDRADRALDAMEAQLVSEDEGIIRLLTPAFDRTPHDPGYIKGYLPGVRENGGQYTHAALWAVRALAEAGRGERAAPLLEMLSPASHTRTAHAVATYQVEPYVIAADVYGVAPHVGRGGWTWYTGSAGWMSRVALESVLGLRLVNGDVLELRPSIPRAWPGFTVHWRLPDGRTTYEITVTRGGDGAASRAMLGDHSVAATDGALRVPLRRDGAVHQVAVTLGGDVGPRYRAHLAPHIPSDATAPSASAARPDGR